METNEKLIKAWIGEKNQDKHYQKVMNGGFSWVTCLLPDLHMATRKMYLEVFIYLLVIIIFSVVVKLTSISENAVRILTFIIRVIMGFSFYPLYKRHIISKIRKYEQQGLSYDEQLSIAQKDGGDKITGKTIAVIVLAIVGTIMLYLVTTNALNVRITLGESKNNYNVIENENGNKIFSVDGCQIYYDSNKWGIKEVSGYEVLQYTNEDCYVAYEGKQQSNIKMEELETNEFRDTFEDEMEKNLQNNLKIHNIEYNKINNELYEIGITVYGDNYKGITYMYITNSYTVTFNVMGKGDNLEFESAAQNMLRTIQFEDGNSIISDNNEVETNTSNKNESNSDNETVGNLKFTLPDGYEEYNTESFSAYINEESLTSIYISTSPSNYYESIEDFAEKYIYNFDLVNHLGNENINGIEWIKYEIESTYNKEYCYLTNYEGEFYLVEFVLIEKEYENNAIKHLETIKNSFELQ